MFRLPQENYYESKTPEPYSKSILFQLCGQTEFRVVQYCCYCCLFQLYQITHVMKNKCGRTETVESSDGVTMKPLNVSCCLCNIHACEIRGNKLKHLYQGSHYTFQSQKEKLLAMNQMRDNVSHQTRCYGLHFTL